MSKEELDKILDEVEDETGIGITGYREFNIFSAFLYNKLKEREGLSK